ncbi:MAG: hypothetical protein CMJ19_22935 [Phycisphaeraceae bacterium]|nr:hypothetical protein [Phycisphaeraceae bacterium]
MTGKCQTRRVTSNNRRGFSMLVVVGVAGIITLAVTAMSAMFAHQALRTRTLHQQAQQRQMEIAQVLLGNEQVRVPEQE